MGCDHKHPNFRFILAICFLICIVCKACTAQLSCCVSKAVARCYRRSKRTASIAFANRHTHQHRIPEMICVVRWGVDSVSHQHRTSEMICVVAWVLFPGMFLCLFTFNSLRPHAVQSRSHIPGLWRALVGNGY